MGKNIKQKNQYLLRFPPRKFLLEKIDIASVFNEFFSSIGQQLLNDIDHREPVALDYFDFSMSFKPVTSGEVEETKNFLRACTSSCLRGILTVVIKILETVSSGPLVNLVIEDICSVTFLADSKCAKVVTL